MKMLKALPFVVLVLGASAAFADDQHLTDHLAVNRAQDSSEHRSTTVAVYANGRGAGSAQSQSSDARLSQRDNGHGQLRQSYVANE
jgi:hypothetical protein